MDRSGPPVKLIRMPLAPSIDVSSSSGLATAFCAASSARCSPFPVPAPINAMPIPDMIVRTSAKSRLMSPGTRIKSEIPCTAWSNTWSATRNASSRGVPRSTTASRRWFGIVISVSTTCASSAMPVSACCARLRPSNTNGFVTTATVRMPRLLATCATTGADPVPVPPPSPAVTKTMSAPSITFSIRSRSSSAAFRPISGSEPAPSPAVSRAPSWILTGAGDDFRACRSVLATMNSTPVNLASIIRLIALEPPPPIPMTLILAASRSSSSSNTGCHPRVSAISSSLLFCGDCLVQPEQSARHRPALRRHVSTVHSIDRLQQLTEPSPHAPAHPLHEGSARRLGHGLDAPHRAGQSQPHGGGIRGALDDIAESSESGRRAPADGHVEDLLGQLGHAAHHRGAARDDHARGRHIFEPGTREVPRHEREDFLDSRLDDLRQQMARELSRLATAHGRDLDGLVLPDQCRERAAMALLQLLGIVGGRPEPDRDVVRDVVAAQRQDARVPDAAVTEERHVGGPAAEVDHQHAEVLLLGGDRRFGRRQRLKDDVLDLEPRAVDAADDVSHRRRRAGHHVYLHFQARAEHAERLPHAVLVVHDVRLGQHVDDFPVGRKLDGARGFERAIDVGLTHLAVFA